jgi:hypothetical protein
MGYIGANDPLEEFIGWYLQFRERNDMPTPPQRKQFRRTFRGFGDSFDPRGAADFLASAVNSKVAAANMTNQAAAQQIIAAADESIATFLDSDDICPRWPFPGPPPWLAVIASELTLVANTLQEGSLRAGILQVAGQVLDRAQAVSTGATGTALAPARAA